MRDTETETLWSHLLGRGMQGELEGTELERIPSVISTWDDWLQRHPETSVLAMKRTVGGYDRAQWERPRRFVFGVVEPEEKRATAVGLQKLQRDGVVTVSKGGRSLVFSHRERGGAVQAFQAFVAGKPSVFTATTGEFMIDAATKSSWNRMTGEAISGPQKGKRLDPVPGTLSFTQAWEAFYPKSEMVK